MSNRCCDCQCGWGDVEEMGAEHPSFSVAEVCRQLLNDATVTVTAVNTVAVPCAAAQGLSLGVTGDGEAAASLGLPDVLLVIVVLGEDGDLVGHEVCRVEAHTELADHGDVSTSRQGLHEGTGARAGDGTQVVDQVGLGHADTAVLDGEGVVGLVGDEVDEQLWLGLQHSLVCEGLEADLVNGIAGIADQLTKEDFLHAGNDQDSSQGQSMRCTDNPLWRIPSARQVLLLRWVPSCLSCWA